MMATTINGKGAYYAKAIRNWANAFLRSGAIPVSERGKHKKLGCFFRDEDVREKINTYLQENKFEVRIHTLTKYINEEVLLDLDDGLSMKLFKRTVIRWMKIFGHSYREATKGVSQPHFEGTVRSPLTLSKMGVWSPPRHPKTQKTISGVKTPCIGGLLTSLERF
jgi:hypothetical protein